MFHSPVIGVGPKLERETSRALAGSDGKSIPAQDESDEGAFVLAAASAMCGACDRPMFRGGLAAHQGKRSNRSMTLSEHTHRHSETV